MLCLTMRKPILLVVFLAIGAAYAIEPTSAEMAAARRWEQETLGGTTTNLPFSFCYGGKRAPDASWRRKDTECGFSLLDPSGVLSVEVEVRRYHGFPAVSWMLRFRNVSARRSDVVSNVRTFDMALPSKARDGLYLVHHAAGARQSLDDYQQFTTLLSAEWWRRHDLHIATDGGRSCASAWPYFNLEAPAAKAGIVAALGWAGQWDAFFDTLSGDGLKMTAGLSDCRFWLAPGEAVRTPRAIVLHYRRSDWIEAQNLWRAWFLAHNSPRVAGKVVPFQTMILDARHPFHSDRYCAEEMCCQVDEYAAHGFEVDYWWIDAAWYKWSSQWNDPKTREPHWRWTGDWTPDPVRFPRGPGEVFDHARRKHVAKDGILWFETENVVPSSPVFKEHPEWFYELPAFRGRCLNLGDENAWKWAFETVDGRLRRERAHFYRQDFNFAPLPIWRNADARGGEKDRRGISEMKHVEGLYRLYAELLKADPLRRIDNCAQGGCRNDWESLSYSTTLWRTDTSGPVDEQQMQTLGISLWIPLYGGGHPRRVEEYELRSRLQPYLNVGADCKSEDEWRLLGRNLEIWRRHLARYYVKDFYPLTRSDAGKDLWCAWQFVDSAEGCGFVQLFRREKAASPSFIVRPRGLDTAERYVFADVDGGGEWTVAGDGEFEVRCPTPRSARILVFRRAGDAGRVQIANNAMREFLARPRSERMGLMLDEAFRREAKKAGSCPKPFLLAVSGVADGAVVEVRRADGVGAARRFSARDGKAAIDNLEVARRYRWQTLVGGRAVATGEFETEAAAPRVCRIDGVGNVRDFGGWRCIGGRIKQGLVYRSAAFNDTALTEGGDKSKWRPGRMRMSESSRREALATFGFRTDLDLRTEGETFGMSGSPLGGDVRWLRIRSSNYEAMTNAQSRAAFARGLRAIMAPDSLPAVVHCVGGADRTGSFFFLLGGILGMDEEDLYRDWELTAFDYEPLKFNHWNYIGGLTRALDAAYPKLALNEQCVAYAKDCGIADGEISQLRVMLLERD